MLLTAKPEINLLAGWFYVFRGPLIISGRSDW